MNILNQIMQVVNHITVLYLMLKCEQLASIIANNFIKIIIIHLQKH